jgi:predicted nicotinamide N-methyase
MSAAGDRILTNEYGDYPLLEFRMPAAGHEIVVCGEAINITTDDEMEFFDGLRYTVPFAAALWPGAIGLAEQLAELAEEFADRYVLELGAGIGLPGIVAAALGARVVQTDHKVVSAELAQRNAELNGIGNIEYRLSAWTSWHNRDRYDWIIGSDILYYDDMHPFLMEILDRNLAPDGRVLLADPYRPPALSFLDRVLAEGWQVTTFQRTIRLDDRTRDVGIFLLEKSPLPSVSNED